MLLDPEKWPRTNYGRRNIATEGSEKGREKRAALFYTVKREVVKSALCGSTRAGDHRRLKKAKPGKPKEMRKKRPFFGAEKAPPERKKRERAIKKLNFFEASHAPCGVSSRGNWRNVCRNYEKSLTKV